MVCTGCCSAVRLKASTKEPWELVGSLRHLLWTRCNWYPFTWLLMSAKILKSAKFNCTYEEQTCDRVVFHPAFEVISIHSAWLKKNNLVSTPHQNTWYQWLTVMMNSTGQHFENILVAVLSRVRREMDSPRFIQYRDRNVEMLKGDIIVDIIMRAINVWATMIKVLFPYWGCQIWTLSLDTECIW